ncbi:STAS domain-containing protein [Actinoplanes sp. Pm04-4]|uniref:Anti-sigma factor antagonist n=1 Tax=Paractinoplanes pyxinae TaxID=2997416 RepID=A0ABT4AV76_9ACTN|nr:STAS domain-containing protein [Actinoplanes pyxinae]MCY1138139.1 STAS domain-containing protein [Actinoplanes pyxinae]
MTGQLTVTVGKSDGRVTVLTLSGELDRDETHLLEEAGEAALASGIQLLVLDLRSVTFCDSSGLRTFVHLHRLATARGACLRLAELHPPVSTVVEVVNLDRMLSLHPTVADALIL